MAKSPLSTYLHDHLAGSRFAVELLESLHERHTGEALGEAAWDLRSEVEKDRKTLQRIADRVGPGAGDLREGVAWLSEKVARWKLSSGPEWNLGTLEALETLALGIQGKAALWSALAAAAESDERLRGEDYAGLIERARKQHDALEVHRLEVARTVLGRAKET